MLWHVANTGLHLLGSVHIARSPLVLTESASRALNQAERIVFESNFETRVTISDTLYPHGEELARNVSVPLYQAATALAERLGLPIELLASYRPWWAALQLMNRILEESGYQRANGIDHRALFISKELNKSTFFLESPAASVPPLAHAPLYEQELALSRVCQRSDEGLQEVSSIVEAWLSGNPQNLLPILQRSVQQMPNTYSALLADRNQAWLGQLLRFANSGRRVVAVVGALHMVGSDSLPNLLGRSGQPCYLLP